jgi:hypothetical protein
MAVWTFFTVLLLLILKIYNEHFLQKIGLLFFRHLRRQLYSSFKAQAIDFIFFVVC